MWGSWTSNSTCCCIICVQMYWSIALSVHLIATNWWTSLLMWWDNKLQFYILYLSNTNEWVSECMRKSKLLHQPGYIYFAGYKITSFRYSSGVRWNNYIKLSTPTSGMSMMAVVIFMWLYIPMIARWSAITLSTVFNKLASIFREII